MESIKLNSKNPGRDWPETIRNLKGGELVIVENPHAAELVARAVTRMRPDLKIIIQVERSGED